MHTYQVPSRKRLLNGYKLFFISLGVALALTYLFVILYDSQNAYMLGFPSMLLAVLLLAVTLFPLSLVIFKRIDWSRPLALAGIFSVIGYSLPALYHVFARDLLGAHIIDTVALKTNTADYSWLLLNILLGFTIIFGIATYFEVKGRLIPYRPKRISNIYTLWVGIALLAVGLLASFKLYGSLSSYFQSFLRMGLREAPEIGMAKYFILSKMAFPGALLTFLAVHRQFKIRKRMLRFLVLGGCLVAGGVSFYNTGGRAQLGMYIITWLLVYHIGVRSVSRKVIIITGIFLVIVAILIGQIRSLTGRPDVQGILIEDLFTFTNSPYSTSTIVNQPIGLKIDQTGSSLVTFHYLEKWLFAETWWAGLVQPLNAVFRLAGLDLEIDRGWMMINYHGLWLHGDSTYTGNPSTLIGEAYANLGLLGVVLSSLFLGLIIGVLSHFTPPSMLAKNYNKTSYRIRQIKIRNSPAYKDDARYTFYIVLISYWSGQIIPILVLSGFDRIWSAVVFQMLPIQILYGIGKIVSNK